MQLRLANRLKTIPPPWILQDHGMAIGFGSGSPLVVALLADFKRQVREKPVEQGGPAHRNLAKPTARPRLLVTIP